MPRGPRDGGRAGAGGRVTATSRKRDRLTGLDIRVLMGEHGRKRERHGGDPDQRREHRDQRERDSRPEEARRNDRG